MNTIKGVQLNCMLWSLPILFVALLIGQAEAQVSCFAYGANTVVCDGDDLHSRTYQDLGSSLDRPSGQGVIIDERGNVTPYTVSPGTGLNNFLLDTPTARERSSSIDQQLGDRTGPSFYGDLPYYGNDLLR